MGGKRLAAAKIALSANCTHWINSLNPPGGSIGWRNGSKRIIVWFGDAPGHDPICTKVSGLSYDITEESVTKKLRDEKIIVLAISLSTTTPGMSVAKGRLDGDPRESSFTYKNYCPIGGQAGQATRITQQTGGMLKKDIKPEELVNTMTDLVKTAATGINTIKLVQTGSIAPFVSSIEPAAGYGPLSGDTQHNLAFQVQFTGNYPAAATEQVFEGTLDVVADGSVVAQKKVKVTVPAQSQPIPNRPGIEGPNNGFSHPSSGQPFAGGQIHPIGCATPGSSTWYGQTLVFQAQGHPFTQQSGDSFNYLASQLIGNGSLTMRVVDVDKLHNWAQVAIQIRQTLDENSPNAMILWQPDQSVLFQYRDTAGNLSPLQAYQQQGYALPTWLKIVRTDNTITGLASQDGKNFQVIGQVTLFMPSQVYLGVALTSNACQPVTAMLDQIQMGGHVLSDKPTSE